MEPDNFAELEFPKVDNDTLEPQFIIDWGKAAGFRSFFEAVNGKPYDQWEDMFLHVPYRNKGTILYLSSDGKNITIQMPRGRTEFEYRCIQILVDLKSCGYAFAGIAQDHNNATELRDLFACARGIMELDGTCNSRKNRDFIADALRKLVSGNLELELAAAGYLGLSCEQLSRAFKNLLDSVNSTAGNIVKLFTGIISGTTQLEALMSSVRGTTPKQLESSRVHTVPAKYWLSYAQRIDQTLVSLDFNILDAWQVCWTEVQSIFGNVISQTHTLSNTFLAVRLDHRDGLANLVAIVPDIVLQLQEIFELADQAILIVRQFVENEERIEDIFWGIDCVNAITALPVRQLVPHDIEGPGGGTLLFQM